jgi:hypothetical protein
LPKRTARDFTAVELPPMLQTADFVTAGRFHTPPDQGFSWKFGWIADESCRLVCSETLRVSDQGNGGRSVGGRAATTAASDQQ